MTEADLIAALRPVVEALDALGVRYFLGGSVASSAHGVARASLDADVIAELDLSHVDQLAHRLTGAYYVPIEQMRTAAADPGRARSGARRAGDVCPGLFR